MQEMQYSQSEAELGGSGKVSSEAAGRINCDIIRKDFPLTCRVCHHRKATWLRENWRYHHLNLLELAQHCQKVILFQSGTDVPGPYFIIMV